MRVIRGLFVMVLVVACSSKGQSEDTASPTPLDIAPDGFREISPTIRVQTVILHPQTTVYAIQDHREFFKIEVGSKAYPREVSIPVHALAKGSSLVYIVVRALAADRPDSLSQTRPAPRDSAGGNGSGDLCTMCENCCPPPTACRASYRCETGEWKLDLQRTQCPCTDTLLKSQGTCAKDQEGDELPLAMSCP